jgi:chromosome segregation ATPase
MRLPFSGRNAKLESINRILTDAAQKRAERIKELEHQVSQLERQVAYLKTELESARKRATEPEVVAAQHARLLNEKDEELAGLREVLTQRAGSLNEKDEGIAGAREALTKCSLRILELENALLEIYNK